MTPERAKALEAVATIVQRMRKRADAGEWHGGKEFDDWAELRPLLNALFALPAEPVDAGEMVEVRGAVMWDSGEVFVVPPDDTGAYTGIQIATITARIPRPVVPEVRAEVET